MTPAESHIVGAMAITGLSVVVGTIAAGNRPTFKPIAGVGVAGFVLLAAAQSDSFGPLAGQFATLIAVTAVLTSGYFAAAGVGRYFTNERTSTNG